MTTITGAQPRQLAVTREAALRFALGVVLSALSGVMLLLSFPPFGLWPLVWFAFVPYLFAQHRLFSRKWSSLAPAIALLLWLGPFMARLFGTEISPFFTYLGVLIAILSFFAQKERKFHEITHYRWFILQGVFAWVGFEMIRATIIPLVATSAFIGYTQAAQPWLIQPVSIFSVYGLNLLIMLVNFALAQSAMLWFDRHLAVADVVPVDVRATRRWLALTGVLAISWVGISLAILNGTPLDAPTVRVAALQPGYTRPAFQDEVNTSQARFAAFAENARAAARQGAQILYTPEMMFNFDPQVEFTDEFRALAKEIDAYIFITYVVAKEGEPWRNESILLSPSGEFSDVYGKNKIPPGEPYTATAGVYPVFETSLGRLATEICHDANYTDVTRKLVSNGAQLISAGLNEFGGFGEQYWTNATFRAVENRTSLVVSARDTGSAIIDPYGRQVALDIDPGKQAILVGDVSLGAGTTLYTSLGDLLGWASLAAYILFMVFEVMTTRQAKEPAKS
ncbi:MAG: nitrilase-related carbon-nitrogen hydrolase [Anaerolineales bacterium]|jgi:apolipoprotein N-acyltransferase